MNRETISAIILVFVLLSSTIGVADNFYWVGGDGKWSNEDNWAKTSGGSDLHGRVPTLKDNIIFDELSFDADGQAVKIDILNADILNADFSNVDRPFRLQVIAGGRNLTIHGSFIANENFGSDLNEIIFADGPAAAKVNSGGARIANNVYINSNEDIELTTEGASLCTNLYKYGAGTLSLEDSLPISNSIQILAGQLVTNNHSISCRDINLSGTNTKIQLMGSKIYAEHWAASQLNTFSAGTSTILVSETWGGVFSGGSYDYYEVILCGKISVYGNNSYQKLTFCESSDIELSAGSVQSIDHFQAQGSPARPIRIASDQFEIQAYFKKTSGAINASSLNLEDVHAIGGASFNADNSVDLGNVKGWNISIPESKKFYWVGGTGHWSDYQNHWAKSSGSNDYHEALPNVYDEVIFDENSFATNGEVIIDQYNIYAGDMDWSNIDRQVTLRNMDFGGQDYIFSKLHVFGSLVFSDLASSTLNYIRFKSSQDEVVDGAKSYLAHTLVFYHTATYSIEAHSAEIATDILLNRKGTTIIEDSVLLRGRLELFEGSLILDSSYIACNNIYLSGHTADITRSEIKTQSWNLNQLNTFMADSSTIRIDGPGTFLGGSRDYFDVILCGAVTIDGENTYNKLEFCPGSDIYLPAGYKQLADTLAITGDPGFPVSISSSVDGSSAELAQKGGSVDTRYMYLQDNRATGATFNAEESIELGNVNGWNVVAPDAQKFYWVNGQGNWSQYSTHWAKSSGGSDFHVRIPGALDEVIIDDASFNANNQYINIDQIKAYTSNIDFSTANRNFNVNGSQELWCFGNFFFNELGSSNLPVLKMPVDTAQFTLDSRGRYIASLLLFRHKGTYDLYTNDRPLGNELLLTNGGVINLHGSLLLNAQMNVQMGAFESNDHHMVIPTILFGTQNAAVTADIGSSFIEVKSWNVGESVDFTSDTSLIHVLDPSYRAYFNGGSKNYYKVNTACAVDFTGNNSFERLTITYGARVNINGEQKVGDLAAVGTSGNPIKISGGSFSRMPGKSVNEYLILTNNKSTGEGQLIAERSIDNGGNDGWMISPPDVNVDANTLNILKGDPLCGTQIETTLSLPPGLLTSYKWFRDGVALASDSSAIVVEEEGVYHVELTNACGTVAKSNEIEIRREGPPEVPAINVEGTTSICGNQPIEVDLSTEEQPRVHYRWLRNDMVIGEDEPNLFIDEEGTYRLRLTKGECVVESTDSVIVVIKEDVPLPQNLQLLGQDTICLGDSSRLLVNYEKGTTYHWQTSDTTISTQANFYAVKSEGLYTLKMENGCGTTQADGQKNIIVKVKPAQQIISLDGPDTFCFYDSSLLKVPLEKEVTYRWLVNDSSLVLNSTRNTAYTDTAGHYYVAMTNRCGTTVSDQLQITHLFLPEPRDIVLEGDSVFCVGDSIGLSLDYVSGESWDWFENDKIIQQDQPIIYLNQPGLYALSITNVCGTIEANNKVPVRVLPIPDETIVKDHYEICGTGELTVQVEGGEDGNYVWRDENGQIIPGLDADVIIVPLNDSKDYFVTLTNGYCEGPGSIVHMNVLEMPVADAGEDKSVIYGDQVVIGGNNDHPNTYYSWTPAVGVNNTRIPNPIVKPQETTTYVLEAIGQNRCHAFDSVIVTVHYDLVIPNTFTPNNDGTNDTWHIRNIEFHSDSKLEIFNRWGTKLYEKTGYQNDWDGTYKGQRLPVDTYFYVIRSQGFARPYKGSITILK